MARRQHAGLATLRGQSTDDAPSTVEATDVAEASIEPAPPEASADPPAPELPTSEESPVVKLAQAFLDLHVVQLSLPLGEIPAEAFFSRHVDVQLSIAQARMMRRLAEGLQNQNARLENGRRVTSSADAVRYVLERLGTR